jgi:hypothetical protein
MRPHKQEVSLEMPHENTREIRSAAPFRRTAPSHFKKEAALLTAVGCRAAREGPCAKPPSGRSHRRHRLNTSIQKYRTQATHHLRGKAPILSLGSFCQRPPAWYPGTNRSDQDARAIGVAARSCVSMFAPSRAAPSRVQGETRGVNEGLRLSGREDGQGRAGSRRHPTSRNADHCLTTLEALLSCDRGLKGNPTPAG